MPNGGLPVADHADDRSLTPGDVRTLNTGDGFVPPTDIDLDSAHDPAGAAA